MQLKEKRDAAILEKHKEGMSNRAIAKLFKMGPNNGHNVVKEVIENALVENPDSGKSTTPEVATSAVPMASTEDRSETREDARS
ncbi:helix-turn-helix domain-containing protein [Aeromonas veronii]|uniref:helix-turn-helix domain-containing protein n=1 Tax=Aeromonas veronii TaxID=654 RepID=UPI002B490EF8|nr:helix-turn-helix domain-containing protein [Aeromonas veronii]